MTTTSSSMRAAPTAVLGGAVGLQREDHADLDLDRVIERVQPRDHRRLVEADAEAVAELQAEARLLVGEAELLRRGPDGGDRVGRHARPHEVDRVVEPLAALLVGVELRLVGAPHRERAVVARAVAHEGVDDVEERLVAGAQQAVGEDVRVRGAAVAGDGVDRLDVLGAELEQELVRMRRRPGSRGFPGAASGRSVVDGVDDSGGVIEQRDLVRRLDLARLCITGAASLSAMPALCSATIVGMSVMSMPTGSPSRPRSVSVSEMCPAMRSGTPVSSGIAPRMASTPAASSPRGARGRKAGGAWRPSRSPTARVADTRERARSGRSCRAPTRRCACW